MARGTPSRPLPIEYDEGRGRAGEGRAELTRRAVSAPGEWFALRTPSDGALPGEASQKKRRGLGRGRAAGV